MPWPCLLPCSGQCPSPLDSALPSSKSLGPSPALPWGPGSKLRAVLQHEDRASLLWLTDILFYQGRNGLGRDRKPLTASSKTTPNFPALFNHPSLGLLVPSLAPTPNQRVEGAHRSHSVPHPPSPSAPSRRGALRGSADSLHYSRCWRSRRPGRTGARCQRHCTRCAGHWRGAR